MHRISDFIIFVTSPAISWSYHVVSPYLNTQLELINRVLPLEFWKAHFVLEGIRKA